MNTIIFFIALYAKSNYAGNRSLYCIDVQVFRGKLVKFIHKLLSSSPGFSPIFMSIYIYFEFEYYRIAVSHVSKSHSCISVKVDLFRCPAGDRKFPPPNICGKEVDSGEKSIPQTAYLSSEGNKCDPPQDFNAKGESTRTTRFHFKTKEFILTRFSTLAILPH